MKSRSNEKHPNRERDFRPVLDPALSFRQQTFGPRGDEEPELCGEIFRLAKVSLLSPIGMLMKAGKGHLAVSKPPFEET